MTDLRGETTTDDIEEIAQKIINSFVWSSTPQGATYWDNVYNNLREIVQEVRDCRYCGEQITLNSSKVWVHTNTRLERCTSVATP